MPIGTADLPLIEAALHSDKESVVLVDGTSLSIVVVRPKANSGKGARSIRDVSVVGEQNVQIQTHDCRKSSKFTELAKAGRFVSWVLVGKFPKRAAVTMVDGALVSAIDCFPGAAVAPLPPITGIGDGAADVVAPAVGVCTLAEALVVHAGLHSESGDVRVGDETLEVQFKGKMRERFCKFRGTIFRQQLPNGTAGGKLVKSSGCKMTWIESAGGWGQIVDGKLTKTCEFVLEASELETEPPTKKSKTESIESKPADAVGSAASGASSSSDAVAPIGSAPPCALPSQGALDLELQDIDKDIDGFWKLEEILAANIHGRNEDYNENLIKKGDKPVSFVLVAAQAVQNPMLTSRFEARVAAIAAERSKKDARERYAFHGTHPSKLMTLCGNGLLPFGHPLNPSAKPVDDGYFGSCRKGVYVSRYADYTLKYANRMAPLRAGERCRIVLFRCVPGLSFHVEKLCGPIDPTPGFDSHSSPQFLEWFLFHPDQCCPTHILTIEAVQDTRTASDDK